MMTHVIYLRPSRTIEVISGRLNSWFIYNYEGYHFRVFSSEKDIKDFFSKGRCNYVFETTSEEELDEFLFNKL